MKLLEFEKVADMLAKEHKIQIKAGQGWAANIKQRDVFYRKDDVYNLPEDHILGLLLHEVAHIHYTDDVEMPKDNPELTHTILNVLEDISIEYIISKDYPNAGEILESTKDEVLDTLVKMLPKMQHVSMFEKSLLYAATRFEGRGYKFPVSDYEKLGEKISVVMLAEEQNIYNRIKTKDLMPLVEKIRDMLIAELGQPTEQQKEEMRQGNEAQAGKANGNEKQDEVKSKIIKGLKAGTGWKEGPPLSMQVKFVDKIADQANAIGKQLRTVLKRNNAMEFGGRYRTGKLLTKRFVRIKVLKDRNPFARRIVKSNQSYAFAIASDVSGSMFNGCQRINDADNGSYALSSMHMVGEALRQANIPRAMIVFGGRAPVAVPMCKTQIPWGQIASESMLKKAGQNSTNIDLAINTCTKELSKIRAERKIMIVLTDGSSSLSAMQRAHKNATDKGIECLGITLGYDYQMGNMNQTFGENKNTQITDTKDTSLIGKAFIDILKKTITKG